MSRTNPTSTILFLACSQSFLGCAGDFGASGEDPAYFEDAGPTPDAGPLLDDEISGVTAAVTCPPRMSVFPVSGAHNIGYDSASCRTGTCAVSCPDVNANSDWQVADHQGIDIFAHRGAPLVATAAGTIVAVSVPRPGNPGSGLRVRLRDDCGWDYYYGHLDSATVRLHQRVSAGEQIGTMGNTGTSGVHLHFNISPDGNYSDDINPIELLRSTSATACAPRTCEARCEGSQIIRADCSTGDCAAFGLTCVPGTPEPSCGTPEPENAMGVPGALLPSVSVTGVPRRFTFRTERLFDTREGSADLVYRDGSTSGPLAAGTVATYHATGLDPDVDGLWINLAAISQGDGLFVSAYPLGTARPTASHVNADLGTARANSVPVALGRERGVSFYAEQEAHLVGDLVGTLGPAGAGLTTIAPTRLYDSREIGAPLASDEERRIEVDAPAGATGLVATVAVVAQDAQGFLQAYPCGAVPETSNINFDPMVTVANTVIVPLHDGAFCVRSTAPAHFIVDASGYISPEASLSYQPLMAVRLLDTRSETTPFTGRLGRGQIIELPIAALDGMPDSVWSVAANVTVVGADGPGFASVFPCESGPPSTSSVNFTTASAVGALTMSRLGPSGSMCLYASTRAHFLVDVVGVWVDDESRDPPTPAPGGGVPGDRPAAVGGCSVGAQPSSMWWTLLLLFVVRRRRAS